jgi:hypothetical protein
MYLDQTKQYFRDRTGIPAEAVRGCTDEEVRDLEQYIGRQLPAAYEELLFWMGHGAGYIMQGTDFFYPDIRTLTEDAEDLLRENAFPESLPEDAFVFTMHQGYQFQFFRTSEGADPPVYGFCEGTTKERFDAMQPCFSAWVLAAVEAHIQLHERAEEWHRRAEERRRQQ